MVIFCLLVFDHAVLLLLRDDLHLAFRQTLDVDFELNLTCSFLFLVFRILVQLELQILAPVRGEAISLNLNCPDHMVVVSISIIIFVPLSLVLQPIGELLEKPWLQIVVGKSDLFDVVRPGQIVEEAKDTVICDLVFVEQNR